MTGTAYLRGREVLWIKGAVAYEIHDDPIMPDLEWDAIGIELWANREHLSAPFCHLVFGTWPAPPGEPGENPLKSASGIRWDKPLGRLFVKGHRQKL